MPAIAAQQAALRRSRTVEQGQAAVVPAPGPRRLEADHLGQRAVLRIEGAVGRGAQLARRTGRDRRAGRYTRPLPEVLADVAQDVGQLQGDAERVREPATRPPDRRRTGAGRTRRATAVRSNRRRSGSTRPGRRSSRSAVRRRPSRSRRPVRRTRPAGSAAVGPRRQGRAARGRRDAPPVRWRRRAPP